MKRKFLTVLSLLLVCALVFGACANRPDVPAEPEATATPEPMFTNPLTGEQTYTDYSQTRPVAIMVENNHWDDGTLIAQGGLSQADIVYEMQVESITRNMFLFMDTDGLNNVFPIRSARSYFVSAALSYDAIFAHCGKSIVSANSRPSPLLPQWAKMAS